jgi:hypothetical protein
MILWIGNSFDPLSPPLINQQITKIVFYGSIHGFETIEAFCEGLDIANKMGYQYTMDIYSGTNYKYLQDRYKSVSFKGAVSSEQLMEIVPTYDLVYVPMSFRKDRYAITRTSISVKMIMALQTQIPILAHGPLYSSNTLFAFNNKVGFRINSLYVKDIIEVLNNISFEQRKEASKNARKLYEAKFNTDINVSNFLSFLKQ